MHNRQGSFMSSMVWGVLLVLFGLSMIIKALFGFDIPFVRIVLAAFLIYLGITMITEKPLFEDKNKCASGTCNAPSSIDINVIDVTFSKKIIHQQEYAHIPFLRINTVFGKTVLKLDPTIPTKIVAQAISSSVTFPDGNIVSFGDVVYMTHPSQEPQMVIETKTTFGALEIG